MHLVIKKLTESLKQVNAWIIWLNFFFVSTRDLTFAVWITFKERNLI